MSNSTKAMGLLLLLGTYSGPVTAQAAYASLAPQQAAGASQSPQSAPAQPASQSLKSVLEELKATHGIQFFYSDQLVEGKSLPAARPTFSTWQEELQYVLTQSQLRYEKVADNTYVISPVPAAPAQPQAVSGPVVTAAAPIPVSGRVTQANGEGLPGVTVVVKGSTTGTSTDINGNFTLTAPEGSTLVFSFVGFTTQEVAATAAPLAVVLRGDTQALNEVVVVGYGTQRREDVTGAIASVTEQEIKTQPVTGLDQAMQGRAAGVQVSQNSGAPGGGVSIRVRGVGTVGNAEPLYVVDGVPFYSDGDGQNGNYLNLINPSDIASIDILKDASATAIYGSRGANGVVIITTKRGKSGRSNIGFDTYYGVQQVAHKVNLLNASQFAQLSNELLANGGQQVNSVASAGSAATTPDYSNPAALGQGTDWLKEIFRTAPIQNYNLNVNGGSEKTQFSLSGGFFQQDGTIIGSNFKRYSLRLNLDHQLNSRIKIGTSTGLSRTESRIVTTDEDTQSGLVFLAQTQLPTLPVYRTGTFAGPVGRIQFVGDRSNPVGRAMTLDNHLYRNRLLSSTYAEVEIIKGLRFRTNLGLDASFRENSFFEPSYTWGSIVHPTASLGQGQARELVWLTENTLTYNRTFGENHALTVLVGQSAQNSQNRYLGGSDNAYPYNTLQALSSGSGTYSATSGEFGWSLVSYIGRVNYSFADKYLFTGTVRTDGSSRFGPENKYGVFPSGSVAWRVNQESFLKDVSQVSDLKLRASYGITGNQNIGLYEYATLLSGTQRYVQGNSIVPGVVPTSLPNPAVQWEPNKQLDFGLDLGLLDNRLVFTADIYDRLTTKMLLSPPVTPSSGYLGAATVNAGQVRNQGLELALNTRNFTGAFTWNTNFNISFTRNKVLELINDRPIISGGILTQSVTRTAVGQPIGAFFGYVTDGIFQTGDEVRTHATQQPGTAAGDIRYKDLNNDGVINDQDRAYIGSPIPKFTAGLTNTFAYKGFDLSVFLYAVYGNKIFNANRIFTEAMSGAANQTTETLNRWKSAAEPGDGVTPRAVFGDPNINARVSDRYIEDGSFLRIKNVSLGYTLPAKWLGTTNVHAQSLRLYATAQNLVTFTKYKGFDPEIGSFGQSSLSTGIDNGAYPVSRVLTLGLNVGF
ncbi:SusC/RagA family TonB-linked outer membrane protein [Hymenobacter sp. M29]|uniref:SusC/RagA family TonB-linked outer membrane protein n=1 Tax=Hymenobacter mellowenesis TaxID=3063995 RepID=A0ABT9AFA7_9BACT|nr:SusC/RagA family TonB-linked outer membrane protein [Hymenobacter sp. M29]MDO7848536.1 SusC/RagA family TonB-linked outer membrane protein [Hymenobacter sp. M29]